MIKFIYTIFFLLFISVISSYIYIKNTLNNLANTSVYIDNHKITLSDIQTNFYKIYIQHLEIENTETHESISINNFSAKMNLFNIFKGETLINTIQIGAINLAECKKFSNNTKSNIRHNIFIKYIVPKKLHIEQLKLPNTLSLPFNTLSVNSNIKASHIFTKNIHFTIDSDIKIQNYFLDNLKLSYKIASSTLNNKTRIKNIKLSAGFFDITGNASIDTITSDIESNLKYTIHSTHTMPSNHTFVGDKITGNAKLTKQNDKYILNTKGDLYYSSTNRKFHINYDSNMQIINSMIKGDLNLFKGNQLVIAKTDFAYNNKNLILNNISCKIHDNMINGNLIIDSNFLLTGMLNMNFDNIKDITQIVPNNLPAGALNSTLIFSKEKNKQTLKMKGNARNIELENNYKVKNGSFDITLHDLSNISIEHIAIHLQNIDISNMKFSEFNIKGRHNNISTNLVSRYYQNFNCRTQGNILFLNKKNVQLNFKKIWGTINKQNFHSNKSSNLLINRMENSIKLQTELLVAKGIVSLDYKHSESNLSTISSKIYNLPVNLFQFAQLPFSSINGSMNGDVNISYQSRTKDFNIDSTLKIDSLQFNELHHGHNLDIKINNLNNNLNLTTYLTNEQNIKSITGFINIPLNKTTYKEYLDITKLECSSEFHFNKSRELIQLLNSDVHQKISGTLNGSIKLALKDNTPYVKTNLLLTDGAYENLYSNTKVKNISTKISTNDNNKIECHDIIIADNDNIKKIIGSGHITLSDNMQFAFQLHTKNFPVIDNNYLSGKISGNIDISGNRKSALIGGTIALGPAKINIPSNQKQKIPSLNIETLSTKQKKDTKFLHNYKIFSNISLSLKEKVTFIANGINAKLEGSLKMQNNITNPDFYGNLTIASGKYNNIGKVFKITEGYLNFDGKLPPSPFINIKATSETSNIELQFHLSNSIFEPKIIIQSVPKMAEEDALSIFLFGKESNKVSTVQMVKIAQILSSLYNETPDNFLDKIPLDKIDFTSNDDGDTESITIGKYLMDNLYLQRDQNINNRSSINKIEWKITPKISVEAMNTDDDENSLGVYWNIKY